MINKYLLRELLWIIPNDQLEETEIEGKKFIDGEVRCFSKAIGEAHIAFFSKLFDLLHIQKPNSWNDVTCSFELAKKGFCVIVNSGRPLDGKYFATIFLPKQMTYKQIKFFEENKDLFLEHFHDNLLETAICTDEKLPYNSLYRDLKIEKIIENRKCSNIDMLYEEIERQKDFIKTK